MYIYFASDKVGTAQEIYNDGHQREDVKAALNAYTIQMLALLECTIQYTGENMDRQVVGARLREKDGAAAHHQLPR